MEVRVKVEDNRLEITNPSDTPLQLLSVIVRYRVHVSTIEDGSAIKYVSEEIPINRQITGSYEVPIEIPDVAEVVVVYRVGDKTFQESVPV